jgi:hypothetical protein
MVTQADIDRLEDLEQQENELKRILALEKERAEEARRNKDSLVQQATVNSVVGANNQETTSKQKVGLEKYLEGGAGGLKNAADAKAALEALAQAEEDAARADGVYALSQDKLNRQTAARIQTINAVTAEEKAEAAAATATANALDTKTGKATRDAAAARARAVALAQAAKADNDAVRDATASTTAAVAAANAHTTADRAAAAASAARTAALNQGRGAATAEALAIDAARRVTELANAQAQEAVRVKQIEVESITAQIAAQQLSGVERVREIAQIQETNAMRIAGVDTLSAEGAARIRLAGDVAVLNLRLRDEANAREILAKGRDSVELIDFETKTIGMNEAARKRLIATMQAEMKARELARQGMTESAAAVREEARAIEDASAKRDAAQAKYEQEKAWAEKLAEAWKRYAAAYASAADQIRSQGRDVGLDTHGQLPTPPGGLNGGSTTRASDWPQFGAGGQGQSMTAATPAQIDAAQRDFGGQGNWDIGASTGFNGSKVSVNFSPNAAGIAFYQQKQMQAQQDVLSSSGLGSTESGIAAAIQSLTSVMGSVIKAPANAPRAPTAPKISQGEADPGGLSTFGNNANYFYDPSSRKTFAEQFEGFADKVSAADAKAYTLAMKQYELEMKEYNTQVAAAAASQVAADRAAQQINVLKALLDQAHQAYAQGSQTPLQIAKALNAALSSSGLATTIASAVASTVETTFSSILTTKTATGAATTTNATGSKFGASFAEGGEFTVGGKYGTDANQVLLNLTRGEKVKITNPDNDVGPGKAAPQRPVVNTVNINVKDTGDLKKSSGTARRELMRMQRRLGA